MNDITTELHVRRTNGQGKIMPNTKQTEENNTIKQIECTICSRSTSIEYVSIVKIVNIKGIIKGMIKGDCCDKCAITFRFNNDIILINNDNSIFTPDSITNSELSRSVGYNDKGNRINEIDKYRKSIVKMREINKKYGLIVPTFKQEMKNKIKALNKKPVDPDTIQIDPELLQEIYKKIRSGEIK